MGFHADHMRTCIQEKVQCLFGSWCSDLCRGHPAVRRGECSAASALLMTTGLREWSRPLSKVLASAHACSWRDLPITAGGSGATGNLDMHSPCGPACHEGHF